jgi:hypothetical protein
MKITKDALTDQLTSLQYELDILITQKIIDLLDDYPDEPDIYKNPMLKKEVDNFYESLTKTDLYKKIQRTLFFIYHNN